MNPGARIQCEGCGRCWIALVAAVTFATAAGRCAIAEGREAAAMARTGAGDVAEAFESVDGVPWYNSDADRVHPVPVEPRIDDSVNRDSRWVPKPAKQQAQAQAAPTPATTAMGNSWFQLFQQNILGWLLLGLLVVVVCGLLIWMFTRMEREATGSAKRSSKEDDEPLDEADLERLENLPIEVRSPRGNLLSEADRLRGAGRLDEALIYLFGHRLIQLDRAHALRLARGKTNRQYLRELMGRGDLHTMMADTVHLFERSYFGRHPVTQQAFDTLRGGQAAFEASIARWREAA